MEEVIFILYVKDQNISSDFYKNLLKIDPSLNVPGMTEFNLMNGSKLGLMPENGIAKILIPTLVHPSKGNGIPRCELYLKVSDPKNYISRGISLGAKVISLYQKRDWGDFVGYISDVDGHIIAFAKS